MEPHGDDHQNHFDLEDWLHYFDQVNPPLCWVQTLEKVDSIQVSPVFLRENKAAADDHHVYGIDDQFTYFDPIIDGNYLSWWDGGLPSLVCHIDNDMKNNVEYCHNGAILVSGKVHNNNNNNNPTISDVGAITNSGHRRAGKRSAARRVLEMEEIEKYFELPIVEAAQEMKVGLTVLKKRCRELNIKRWPHRKLKSLNSLIHTVKELGIKGKIEMLEEQKRMMEKVPEIEFTHETKKLRQACFKASYKKRNRINNPIIPLYICP